MLPTQFLEFQPVGQLQLVKMSSMFYPGGVFTLSVAYANFTAQAFFASLLGLLILIGSNIRRPKPEEVLVIVWSILIFYATIQSEPLCILLFSKCFSS